MQCSAPVLSPVLLVLLQPLLARLRSDARPHLPISPSCCRPLFLCDIRIISAAASVPSSLCLPDWTECLFLRPVCVITFSLSLCPLCLAFPGNVWQFSSFSPMLAVLIVVVLVLVIIAFVIVIILKLRTGSSRIRKTRGKQRRASFSPSPLLCAAAVTQSVLC